MAYQPNPFVNPNHRGFELPMGCKDLNDALARLGQGEFKPPSRVEAGGIAAVRSYVARFYEAKSTNLVLVLMFSERGALFIISYTDCKFHLTLLLHQGCTFLEEAIAELFDEAALRSSSDRTEELRTIQIPLPDFWDDAAQRIIDLLIRGYGMPEGARLLFHYQESRGPCVG